VHWIAWRRLENRLAWAGEKHSFLSWAGLEGPGQGPTQHCSSAGLLYTTSPLSLGLSECYCSPKHEETFFFFWCWDRTQGLAHARQALCHQATSQPHEETSGTASFIWTRHHAVSSTHSSLWPLSYPTKVGSWGHDSTVRPGFQGWTPGQSWPTPIFCSWNLKLGLKSTLVRLS
jgi:hypothetical protein